MADQTELNIFIQSMYEQGILDKHFNDLKSLESEANPSFVSSMIAKFFNNADTYIEDLTKFLGESEINYSKVCHSASRLMETSISIGGCLVANQSDNLIEASKAKEKERCIEAFGKVKEAYTILKESLTHIYNEKKTKLQLKKKEY